MGTILSGVGGYIEGEVYLCRLGVGGDGRKIPESNNITLVSKDTQLSFYVRTTYIQGWLVGGGVVIKSTKSETKHLVATKF